MRVSPEASPPNMKERCEIDLSPGTRAVPLESAASAGRLPGAVRALCVMIGSSARREPRRTQAEFRRSPIMASGDGHPRASASGAAAECRSGPMHEAYAVLPFGFDRARDLWLWGPTSRTRLGSGKIRTWHKAHRPGNGSEILRSQQGPDRFALHGQELSAVLLRIRQREGGRGRGRSRGEGSRRRRRKLPRSSRSKKPTTTPRATIFPRSRTKRMSISATTTTTPSSRTKKRKTTTSPTSSASATTTTRSEIFGARVPSRAQPVYPLRHNRCRFRRPFPNAVPNKRAGRLDIAVRRR